MVIKPLVETGNCNNTILCINCVFWEIVSICAAVHLCNWNNFILNHIIPSTVHSSCGSDRDPLGSLHMSLTQCLAVHRHRHVSVKSNDI